MVKLQSSWSGRGGVEVLGRPGPGAGGPAVREFRQSHIAPGPSRGSSPGTSYRKTTEVTALSGRAEPRWVLAGGRQLPSESVARRSRHVRRVEWLVGPMCRADCSQWWPAKLCVQPGRPNFSQVRFRSAGRTVGLDVRHGGAGPSPGPLVSPPARHESPGRVRGHGGPRARESRERT